MIVEETPPLFVLAAKEEKVLLAWALMCRFGSLFSFFSLAVWLSCGVSVLLRISSGPYSGLALSPFFSRISQTGQMIERERRKGDCFNSPARSTAERRLKVLLPRPTEVRTALHGSLAS